MKFIKFLIALLLLPLLVAELWTLLDLVRATLPGATWRNDACGSFLAGFFTWLIVFFFLPRPLWFYVLGHELTHAWAAMLAGGKVVRFHVTSAGGHVAINRRGWWIALSPYFVPIYALIWGALWITIDFYYPLRAWEPILYYGLGLFWAFHISFTLSMLHPRQTDLSGEGYLFSGVTIAFFNLLIVMGLILPLAHTLSWSAIYQLAEFHVLACYRVTGQLIYIAAAAVWQEVRVLNYGG